MSGDHLGRLDAALIGTYLRGLIATGELPAPAESAAPGLPRHIPSNRC